MNYTPIDPSSGHKDSAHIAVASDKKGSPRKKLIMVGFMLLLLVFGATLFFVQRKQIIRGRAEPTVVRWCRDNSFREGISAPSQVTAQADGSFSFTARLPFEADEACATIKERMDEVVVAGLPGATRATTCVTPITSTADCNVTVSWGGRYGQNPTSMEVSGHIITSSCQLYLLAIQGIPACARASVTVISAAVIPTPTTPSITITPLPTTVASPTPTKTPTPTPTKSITPSPTPTSTPTPTVIITATPGPTNTPIPTSVVSPTPTPILIVQATNTPGPTLTSVPTNAPPPTAGSIIPTLGILSIATLVILFGLAL